MAKRNLKFGVEIEFFGVSRQVVSDALNSAGVRAYVEGYNHETKGYWKLVTDGSVNRTGCNNITGGGNEIVSPILYGEEGIAELKLVCKVLEECGAKVDKSCGVHVHHDANDFGLENIKNVFKLYYKFLGAIDYMMPISRRKDYQLSIERDRGLTAYCKPLSRAYVERIDAALSIRGGNYNTDLQYICSDRYHTVNLCSYYKYGTVEFRQHSGSVDGEKVANWVKITNKIMEKAAGKKKVELAADSEWRVCDANWWFRMCVGKDLENYVVNRMAYWRKKEKEAAERAAANA